MSFKLKQAKQKIMTAALSAAIIAVTSASIPMHGFVIYSEKLGNDRRYFYHLQIRLYPCGGYRIVTVHSSGHTWMASCTSICLEDAVMALVAFKRDYYQADAEDRAEAADVYYESLRMAA